MRIVVYLLVGFSSFSLSLCNPCGKSDVPRVDVLGWNNFAARIDARGAYNPGHTIDSFGIYLSAEPRLALNKQNNFMSSAIACSPVEPYPSDISYRFVDSVEIMSDRVYKNTRRVTDLLLVDYANTFSNFNTELASSIPLGTAFVLKEEPNQSDTFTFTFYFYEDGQLLDSAITESFFIRN
jgi:hypothetical protein